MTFDGNARNPGQDGVDKAPDRGGGDEEDNCDSRLWLPRIWILVKEAKVLKKK